MILYDSKLPISCLKFTVSEINNYGEIITAYLAGDIGNSYTLAYRTSFHMKPGMIRSKLSSKLSRLCKALEEIRKEQSVEG